MRKSRYIAWSLSAIPWKTGSSKLLAAIALVGEVAVKPGFGTERFDIRVLPFFT